MSFAKIPLSFKAMNAAYKDNQSLPPDVKAWIVAQNKIEDDYNAKLPDLNDQRAAEGKPPLPKMGHSTSCCMQVSLSFNGVGASIPKAGSVGRDNETIGGANYILAVNEFRSFLTYRFGPTDQITDFSEIKGKTGIVIFGGGHIELFDGNFILQSAAGLAAYASLHRKSGAVMSDGFLNKSRPWWFWELTGDGAQAASDIPDWLVGWWTVYDGNTYYYYFFGDGSVVYIKQAPNPKWTPPKTIGNHGSVAKNDSVHGFTVTWDVLKGETTPTIENFTPLGWTSQTEMNATSNKYSPIYARKIATS
jgi:hypothetical protein